MRRIALISTSSRWIVAVSVALSAACAHTRAQPADGPVAPELQQHLIALMQQSADAWNRGDLDTFLKTYKDDPHTAFMGPQITYGVSDIRARYARSYFKDGKPKAQLSYGDLKFRQLGKDHVLMTGRWFLTDPEGKQQQGYYTLIWENTDDGWKMIHDHSS